MMTFGAVADIEVVRRRAWFVWEMSPPLPEKDDRDEDDDMAEAALATVWAEGWFT